ncbi:TraR/DksA family transcriptional regulator [Streptomyces sp. P17]|uniref:TraR/DksA family transcriptional regulator n=1 Tax=Streptomyces sp. P17 TaxID=3074716 RepID=UPI0028F3FD4D|nr:TraR/DksA family transcriptional regulator [Streptomyces sp. P17]MDT9694478.1 TraR/DksA family transcriptional regulator [Streptomyces sp. P17]
MVAKKTAVQQSASGRSTKASGGAAKDPSGKKSTHGGSAGRSGEAPKPVKTVRGDGTDAGKTRVAKKAVAEKTVAKKAAAKKAAARKATASEAAPAKKAAEEEAAGRPAARKSAGKKAAAKKAVAKKTVAKKTVAKKAAAEEAVAKKAPAKKAPAKKAPARRAVAEKSTSKKSAAKKSTAKKAGAAEAAEQTGATTVVAKKTPGTATAAKTAVPKARLAAAVEPGELAVRPGEDPWTPEEVEEARAELLSEGERLRNELTSSEQALAGLMRDSGDGAGDDQADTGTKNITREQQLALAANAREMLTQTERALERLDAGTYGLCENCGNPIGKARMQAFPRATLCVECKQKQERRY